jgi:hypothetical protein
MTGPSDPQKKTPAFQDLYPHLTGDQLVEAKDRLDRYIALAMGIVERLREDPACRENLRASTSSLEASSFSMIMHWRTIKRRLANLPREANESTLRQSAAIILFLSHPSARLRRSREA